MKLKKSLFFVLLLCLISVSATFLFTACGDKTNGGTTYITEAQAISKAKSGTVKNAIELKLGLNSSKVHWASAKASRSGRSDWQVTVKGTISGYTDYYKLDYTTKKFNAEVSINETGNISFVFVTEIR